MTEAQDTRRSRKFCLPRAPCHLQRKQGLAVDTGAGKAGGSRQYQGQAGPRGIRSWAPISLCKTTTASGVVCEGLGSVNKDHGESSKVRAKHATTQPRCRHLAHRQRRVPGSTPVGTHLGELTYSLEEAGELLPSSGTCKRPQAEPGSKADSSKAVA